MYMGHPALNLDIFHITFEWKLLCIFKAFFSSSWSSCQEIEELLSMNFALLGEADQDWLLQFGPSWKFSSKWPLMGPNAWNKPTHWITHKYLWIHWVKLSQLAGPWTLQPHNYLPPSSSVRFKYHFTIVGVFMVLTCSVWLVSGVQYHSHLSWISTKSTHAYGR